MTYITILTPSSKNWYFWKRKSDLQPIESIFQSKSCGGFTLFVQLYPSVGKISESVVINSFKQIEKVWDELFPIEQARIVSLLVKDITINPDGLNIRIFKEGLHSLSNELNG